MTKKIAVITGSTSGIGEDIAIKFASNNCKVVVVGRNEEKGNWIVEKIREKEGEAIFLKADVSQSSECEDLFKTVLEEYGTVDILVNNAGTMRNMAITDMAEEDWDKVLDVNL